MEQQYKFSLLHWFYNYIQVNYLQTMSKKKLSKVIILGDSA